MPTYEYKCKVCDDRFEIVQSITDDSLTSLNGCDVADDGDHQLKKVFSAVGISFKGEGFYRNDARSGSKAGSRPDSSSGSEGADTSSSSSDNGSSSGSSSSDSGSSSTGSDSSSSASSGDSTGNGSSTTSTAGSTSG